MSSQSEAASSGEVAPAAFDIFVLGTRSSGKSVLLSSLYRQLSSMDGITNFFARCDDPAQHRELCDNYDQMLDSAAGWPAGTYRVDSYDMRCFHRLRGKSLPVFSIRFHDYPGGYVSNQVERRDFIEERAARCNSVMALIDGRKLLDRLEDREDNPAHSLHKDLDSLVRVLQQCVGKPIHFVLTKADLLSPTKYPLNDIVAELKRHKGFSDIVVQQIDAAASCVLVPVSAIGPNFAVIDPADGVIKKRRNGTIEPFHLDVMTSLSMVDTVLDLVRHPEPDGLQSAQGKKRFSTWLNGKLGRKLTYARLLIPAAAPVFGHLGVLGIIALSVASENYIADRTRTFEQKVREIRQDITDRASALEAILKIQHQLLDRFLKRFPVARLGARFDPATRLAPYDNISEGKDTSPSAPAVRAEDNLLAAGAAVTLAGVPKRPTHQGDRTEAGASADPLLNEDTGNASPSLKVDDVLEQSAVDSRGSAPPSAYASRDQDPDSHLDLANAPPIDVERPALDADAGPVGNAAAKDRGADAAASSASLGPVSVAALGDETDSTADAEQFRKQDSEAPVEANVAALPLVEESRLPVDEADVKPDPRHERTPLVSLERVPVATEEGHDPPRSDSDGPADENSRLREPLSFEEESTTMSSLWIDVAQDTRADAQKNHQIVRRRAPFGRVSIGVLIVIVLIGLVVVSRRASNQAAQNFAFRTARLQLADRLTGRWAFKVDGNSGCFEPPLIITRIGDQLSIGDNPPAAIPAESPGGWLKFDTTLYKLDGTTLLVQDVTNTENKPAEFVRCK